MPTQAQLRKIWAAAREIELPEPQLRDLVHAVSGQSSVAELSFAEAGRVIDRLVSLGARKGAGRTPKPRGRRTAPNEVLLLTGEQRRLIEELRYRLGGRWTEDAYFEGACRRLLRRPRPTTAGHGARVIEMLKARERSTPTPCPEEPTE